MSAESTFLLTGLISLLFNTIKDYQTMKIDSTKNFMMTGFVLGFYLFTHGNLLFSLIGLALVMLFNHLTKGIFGSGDQEAFYWIVPGIILVGWYWLFVFGTFLAFFTGAYSVIRSWKKIAPETKTPGFMVLFGSFLLTTSIYLYINL